MVITRISDLWLHCWNARRDIILIGITGVIASSSALSISWISGHYFSGVYDDGSLSHWLLMLLFFAVLLIQVVVSHINLLAINKLNSQFVYQSVTTVLERCVAMPVHAWQGKQSGVLMHHLQMYENSLFQLAPTYLSLVIDVLASVMLSLYLFYCHAQLASIYLILNILVVYIKYQLFPLNVKHYTHQLSERGKLSSLLAECFLQIEKLRSANAENRLYQNCKEKLLAIKMWEWRSKRIDLLFTAIQSLLPLIQMLFLYLALSRQNPPDMLSFIVAAGQLTLLFEMISARSHVLLGLLPGLKYISTLSSREEENEHRGGLSLPEAFEINLNQVSLREESSKRILLNKVSMTIKSGTFTAIIGPSGAGKSSIMRLLLGFYSAYSGSIKINGKDFKHYDLYRFRKNCGVVLQTSQLMPGTIFTNIAGNLKISIHEAWRLAKLVALDKEIEAMPDKMDTLITDNASESISGGQKQKILLARALAGSPKILLLDEATSALDNVSQRFIYNNLLKLKLTLVVVAHRYDTIVDADTIYQINKGEATILESKAVCQVMSALSDQRC